MFEPTDWHAEVGRYRKGLKYIDLWLIWQAQIKTKQYIHKNQKEHKHKTKGNHPTKKEKRN